MSETPLLNLPLMEAGQAQKHVTHNEALLLLDAAIHLSVKSRSHTDPPSSPEDGDRYLVAAPAGGAWSAHDGALALREAMAWRFAVPRAGWRLWVEDEAKLLVFDGTAWRDLQQIDELNDVSLLGINTTANDTNRLAVSSGNTLLTHAGTDHRLKINKQASGDTASLLFQTDYAGRAEMGLAGDDDFHVKVSADGGTWHDAIVIDRATGGVSLPNTAPGGLSSGDKGDLRIGSGGSDWRMERTGGAIGDGVADDTAALQSVLDSGRSIVLGHGKQYRITQRLDITVDGTGILGDGTGHIVMSTGAGAFDNASFTDDRFGTHAVAIRADLVARPVVKGIRIAPDLHVEGLHLHALVFAGCSDITCEDNEAWGFSRSDGVFTFAGCTRGSVARNHVHDCTTNSTAGTSATAQISGLRFDGVLASVTSETCSGITVADNHLHDLFPGVDALAAFGGVADGIQISGAGHGLIVARNVIQRVGLGISTTAHDAAITGNLVEDAHDFGVQLGGGASRNVVSGNQIVRPGLAGIALEGGGADGVDGRITANVIRDVNHAGNHTAADTAGVRVSNLPGDPHAVRRAVIAGNDIDAGGSAKWGIRINSTVANTGGAQIEIRRNLIRNPLLADISVTDAGELAVLEREEALPHSLKGNSSASAAPAADLSPADVRALVLTAGDVLADGAGDARLLWGDDMLNSIGNGGFEMGAAGWALGTGWTIVDDAANALSGNRVAQNTSVSGSSSITATRHLAVMPGERVFAEAWIKTSAAVTMSVCRVEVEWSDRDRVVLSSSSGNNFTAAQLSYVASAVMAVAPAAACFYRVRVTVTKTAGTVWADGLRAVRLLDAGQLLSPGSVTTSLLGGDVTSAGRALLDDASAAAQRVTLGLGSAATEAAAAFAAAAHGHSASDIGSGILAAARLGAGTADGNTFLRGDNTWAAPPGGSITHASDALTTDVALTGTNVFYDGPSVTLAAGTWLLTGHANYHKSATVGSHVTVRLSDGTNHFASQSQFHTSISNIALGFAVSAIITLSSSTVLWLQMATSSGNAAALMKAAAANSPSGNNATMICAIRLA